MEEPAILAAKLQTEGEKVVGFMAGMTATQWTVAVYTEGTTWTARSILAHLMTTERAFLELFQQIREGGGGASEDFSIDRYNAHQQQKTRDLDRDQLLEEYRVARQRMINFVLSLSIQDLERRGRHPFLGVTTLREMVKMIYIHDQMHFRDIRRALDPQ